MKKQNDGNKTKISHRSRTPAGKKDGKTGLSDQLQDGKLTVKYTFERSKEDVKNLHEVTGILEYHFHKMYNTDSQMYRDLPKLTVKLEDMLHDLRKANDDLTAKLDQLHQLRSSFCRIMEICKEKE